MSVTTATATRWTAWLPSLGVAGAGLAVMAALFSPEIGAALTVWSQSTAFGHCYLVLPIALWLAWERRALLLPLTPSPAPAAALLVVPCALTWLFAERLGIMEGRQLAALAMAWMLVPAAFGWRVTAAMAAPLAYLVFLVPFGAFLVAPLQAFTAAFIDLGLGLLAIPHYVNDVLIEIPEGQFQVAEACAGLRFLIAAIAFGALYALLIYRSPWRRLLFLAVSVVAPILANGVRALGIVLLGHVLGSAEAGAVDHVLYGWIFFSMVILLLILLGLPFREDREPFRGQAAPLPSRMPRPATGLAVAAVLVLSGLGPALALAFNRLAVMDMPEPAHFATLPPGCQAVATGSPMERSYACPDGVLLRVRQFGPRAGSGLVQAELQSGERVMDGDEVEHATLNVPGGAWRMSSMPLPERAVASALWLDGRPSPGGLRDRFRLALASLGGGGGAPAVTTLSAAGLGAQRAVRAAAPQVALAAAVAAQE